MKKRHCEADGFENSKVGPRDGTPDPPKKLSLVLPMSFPLQTVHSRYLSYDIYKHLREQLQMQPIPPEILPKIISKKVLNQSPPYRLFGRLPG